MTTRLDRARIRSLFDLSGDVYTTRGGAFAQDPYPVFRKLQETGPVHPGAPHEALGWTGEVVFQGLPCPSRPHFSVYDYASAAKVLRDDQRFVTRVEPLPDEPPMPDAAILFMDGKEHRDHRALVQPSFIPGRATWWLEHFIRRTVDELIDGFAAEDVVDLSLELFAAVPLLTITGSFGISITEAMDVRAAVTSDGRGYQALADLLLPIIASRRAEPADDLISVLVGAELREGEAPPRRLSDGEIFSFSFLLLAAGSGTTWKQLGITLLALLDHPEALADVRRDPAFLRKVIEESMRWMPTDPVFGRYAATDTTLAGVAIPAGAVVHVCLAAANRDPSRWERPDEFDPCRASQPHLGFGRGPHTCLGAHVARAEMTYAISSLVDRFPEMHLDPDSPPPHIIGLYERGPDAVPVRLRRD